MSKKMLITLLVVTLMFAMSACKSGKDAVESLLFTNTSAETTVQTFFCEPGNLSNPDCK
jgi:hypothetical protein